jgi:hypothetical protein
MSSAIVTVASVSTSSIWFKVNVVGTNVSKHMEWTPDFGHDEATLQSDLLSDLITFALGSLDITVGASDIIVVNGPLKLAAV